MLWRYQTCVTAPCMMLYVHYMRSPPVARQPAYIVLVSVPLAPAPPHHFTMTLTPESETYGPAPPSLPQGEVM